jgi:hypothetical protein
MSSSGGAGFIAPKSLEGSDWLERVNHITLVENALSGSSSYGMHGVRVSERVGMCVGRGG